MILRSTDTAPEITPISGMAWHYVWELLEFGVFKNGYAPDTLTPTGGTAASSA